MLRLGAWYALFYFSTFLLLSYLGFRFIRHSLILEDLDLIEAQVVDFRDDYRERPEDSFQSYFSSPHRALFGLVYARLAGDGENVLLSDFPLADPEGLRTRPIDLTSAALRHVRSIDLEGGATIPVRIFSFPVNDSLSIEIARNERPHNHLLEAFLALSLVAAIPLAAIGLLGGAIFTKWSLQPVREVNRAMTAIITTGNFEERVETRAHSGEMGDLVDLCNRLLAHSDRLMKGMRLALDNVAHDLRTPLTRLRVSAESALLGEDDHAAQKEALADSLEEAEHILTMLNTIMEVTAAESDLLPLHRASLSVENLMARLTDLFEFVAEEKHIQIRTVPSPGLTVFADPQRLLQALSNLIDNALKYTPPHGHVVVSARRANNDIVFAVKDDGIGIAAEEQGNIWDRLYRSDASRHEQGLGLGLCMVKAIAIAHGGTVRVHSEPGQGSEFILRIPTVRSAST